MRNCTRQRPRSAPPWWVRAILIFTCTGVSLAHGSNDGQKGIGLIMLILIGILPAHFALNQGYRAPEVTQTLTVVDELEAVLDSNPEVVKAIDQIDGMPSITSAPQQSPFGGLTERFPGSAVEAGAVPKPNAESLREDLRGIRTDLQRRYAAVGHLARFALEYSYPHHAAGLRSGQDRIAAQWSPD